MGCGASSKRRVSTPKRRVSAGGHAKTAPQPEECTEELRSIAQDLDIEACLPRLQLLGVRSLQDIAELLVSDLEEAGLTRVQVRQLQRAVQASTRTAPAISSSPVANDMSAFEPVLAPVTSPQGASVGPCSDAQVAAEISDTESWQRASATGCPEEQPSTLPELGPTLVKADSVRSSPGKVPPPAHREVDSVWSSAARVTPLVERAPTADRTPHAESTTFNLTLTPAGQEAHSSQRGGSMLREAPKCGSTPSGSMPGHAPASLERTLLGTAEEQIVQESSLEQTLIPDALKERTLLSGYCASSSEPESQPAASWHEVMLRQQPESQMERSVGEKLPEAVRKRLDQRSRSRGQGSSTPPYQQQITPPPRSPPLAAPSVSKRSSSVDAPSRTPPKPQRGRSVDSQQHQQQQQQQEKGGRQMFDKNALRRAHRDLFIGGIQRYREQALQLAPGEASGPDLSSCTLRMAPSAVRVYVRKRPLFEHEENERGEYDVATVVPGRPLPTHLVLHSCLFQADLKTPLISHLHFEFDHVFREGAQDHEVYRVAASELVRNSREGGAGTMFMFGQTGSGKTHTMTAIEGMAAHDLYEGAPAGEPWLSLQFVELCGNHCFDLLVASREKRQELRLRERMDGSYEVEGALQLQPSSAQELCAAMSAAHERRATSATDANASSSRSHAVCTLRLLGSGGCLTLADCAGTERRKDSMYHSKERQQEGAEINASLHALKECVRHASTRQRVPSHVFRASALTKLLSAAFSHDGSQLAVICTVSPCALDTEHTLATLRTGMALGGRGTEREEKEVLAPAEQAPREQHPKQWTPQQVSDWLTHVGTGRFQDVRDALPSNFTGQMLIRLTEGRCVQLCGGNDRRGRQLFELLHQEIRRADIARKPHASP